MGFSLLPREDEYFALFSKVSTKLEEAATLLVEMMKASDSEYDTLSKRIKDVEHECDELTHTMTRKLNSSFITPFDREDIYTLSNALDDVCDYIDAVGRAVVMFNIHEIDAHAVRLSEILLKQTKAVHAAILMLEKADGIDKHLLEIQRLENEADDIYFRAMADLFKNGSDPVEIIKWKELYEILENGTDKCEYVGNIIESIILKHS
jgi:predicted phosphate transport protein (TIGR00153 family)